MGDDEFGFHDNKISDNEDDDSMVQSRKRRRLQSDEETPAPSDLQDDRASEQSGGRGFSPDRESTNQIVPLPRKVVEFNDKLVQVIQSPLQPSSTPDHLQHRFMVRPFARLGLGYKPVLMYRPYC